MTNTPNDYGKNDCGNDLLIRDDDERGERHWREGTAKMERRKHRRKVWGIIATCFVVFLALVVLTGTILLYTGKVQLRGEAPQLQVSGETVRYDDNTVLYKDVLYEYNPHVISLLCLGVDYDGQSADATYGTNGQADTLMLVTIDDSNGETVVTAIPRDTVTAIDLYNTDNSYAGTQSKQICLAYAYGDGQAVSCERTATAVSGLFKGIPVNTYVALDLKTLAKINDMVGGVTVTPTSDSTYPISSTETVTVKAGQKLVLYGKNTIPYLQQRGDEVEASLVRMQRQIDYLKALTAKTVEATKEDLTFPAKLFKRVGSETVNNLNINKVSYLTSVVVGNRKEVNIRYQTLTGTQVAGEDGHARFLVDEDALMDIIMDLFYDPINDE